MTIHNKYVTDALLSTTVHLTIEASVTADAQNVCPPVASGETMSWRVVLQDWKNKKNAVC